MSAIGHTEAEKLLYSGDVSKSRSFLLEGPKGIGKAMVAAKFAAHMLGSSVERVLEKSHPDFLLIEKKYDEKAEKHKKEIIIEDARKMGAFLRLTPAESKNRVVIVDSADELNTQAANAILKTVEEPPKSAVIILLSHGNYILPTIRSRCISIKFKPLTQKDFERVMAGVLPAASGADIETLFMLSEGSAGVAKDLYENDGLWLVQELTEIFGEFPRYDYSKLMKIAERMLKTEYGLDIYIHILNWLGVNLAKSGVGAANLGKFDFAGNLNLPLFLDIMPEVQKLFADNEIFNLDKKQVIANSLVKLSECFRAVSV